MGCYQNTGRALADILRGVNGKRTVSKKLNVCRKKADAKGITVFGLDDKQCWTGQNAADTFNNKLLIVLHSSQLPMNPIKMP